MEKKEITEKTEWNQRNYIVIIPFLNLAQMELMRATRSVTVIVIQGKIAAFWQSAVVSLHPSKKDFILHLVRLGFLRNRCSKSNATSLMEKNKKMQKIR
jgi:hypothetical protein